MATQTVEFRAATGLTITAKLFSAGSDTEVASVSATEATNRKGTYSAAYTDVAAGEYVLIALSSGTPVASWWVSLTLSTATFQVYERSDKAGIADSVWDEPYAQHTTAGSFGKLLDTIRKSNLTIDGVVSNAITPTTLTFASDVSATTSAYAHAVLLFVTGPLAGENSPIISYTSTNGVFVLEEPLTAAPSNGDEFVVLAGSHVHAVDDIRDGLIPAINAASLSSSDGRPGAMAKGSTLRWTIYTRSRSTGALADADSTPTVTVRKNGAASAETVTVSKRAATTGIYDCSFNPTGEADGDSFELAESSVLSSVTYRSTFSVSVQPTLSVVIDPLVSTIRSRVSAGVITLFVGEEIDITIEVTDAEGDPVDLTTKNLIMVFEEYDKSDLAAITSFTISGGDNNNVTMTVPAAVTATVTTNSRPHLWSLRDQDDGDRVLAYGTAVIKLTALQD